MIKVNGSQVQVQFDDWFQEFDAAQLDARVVEQAVAYAIAGRFASIATASKDKPELIKGKIEEVVKMWNGGQWTKTAPAESAEVQLARKMGMTVEELMAKLGK